MRSEWDVEGSVEARCVEELFIGSAPIISLQVEGQEIKTTREHPFWVHGKGWTCAGALQPGDKLSSHDGEWHAVEAIIDLDEWAIVYNLRVNEYHTYFVGAREWGFSVWAHNTCYEIRRLADGTLGLYEIATGRPVMLNGAHITGRDADVVRRAASAVPEIAAGGIAEGVSPRIGTPSAFSLERIDTTNLRRTGNSAELQRQMELANPGVTMRADQTAHHIIPEDFLMSPEYRASGQFHPALVESGFRMNSVPNGIALPSGAGQYHSGRHPAYTEAIRQALDAVPVNQILARHPGLAGRQLIAVRVGEIQQATRRILERAGTAQEIPLTLGNVRNSTNPAMRSIRTQAELERAWIEGLRNEGVRF